jgi:excisionase family DNA binding protein
MEARDIHFVTSKNRLKATIEEAVERAVAAALERSRSSRTPGGKDWLTNEEAMAYLGLSRPTLARYRKAGTLPFSKVGSSVFYRQEDVAELLERNLQRGR